MKPDYPILEFKNAASFRSWLVEHHTTAQGIWLKVYKKASGVESIKIEEALDQALCFGWIDGQRNKLDDEAYLQKYTPRRSKSLWSKRNIEYIERLTAAGLMMPAGAAQVEAAQADGRWAAAYDRQRDMVVPDDFLAELHKHPRAEAFYATLGRSNLFAIAWRLQTAKTPETRARRMEKLIAMLDSEQKLH